MTTDPLAARNGPRRLPPPGGADRAVTAGRRRLRRRRATTTAAGVLLGLVASAAVAAAHHPDAGSGLVPTHTHPGASATTRAGAPPTTLPTPSLPAVGPVPPALDGPTAIPPVGQPTTSPTPTPDAVRRWVGLSSHDVSAAPTNDPTACAAHPEYAEATARTGFCTMLAGPSEITVGTAARISFTLCRAGGTQPATLTYDTKVETAFSAARDNHSAWTWAREFTPVRHTLTFDAGDCMTWTVSWSGQDDEGWALPDGQYEVDAMAVPNEWVDENGNDTGPPPTFQMVTLTG